jgi:hypothetical protein
LGERKLHLTESAAARRLLSTAADLTRAAVKQIPEPVTASCC